MSKTVYFTGNIALIDNLGIEECMAIQEPLRKLAEYETLDDEGLLLRLSKPIDKDLIKAVRCLASQNAFENEDECHMDIWNRCHKEDKDFIPMACGNHEKSVGCPFYQEKYGVCFKKGQQEAWLRELADLLSGK